MAVMVTVSPVPVLGVFGEPVKVTVEPVVLERPTPGNPDIAQV